MEIEAEVAVGLRDLSPPPSPPMEMFMTPSLRTDPIIIKMYMFGCAKFLLHTRFSETVMELQKST